MQSIFEADPAFWQSGAIHSRLGDIRDLSRLPFLRIKVQGVGLDLGTLINSKATYIKITAADLAADDLRLAYSKIMTEYEVTDEEGSDVEDGTVQASAMGPAPGPSSFETAASARLRPRSRRARRATRPPADGASLFDRCAGWPATTSYTSPPCHDLMTFADPASLTASSRHHVSIETIRLGLLSATLSMSSM